jgi:hypothetical protein
MTSSDESITFSGQDEIRLLADVADLACITLDNQPPLRMYPRHARDQIIRAFIDELADICESVSN